MPIENEFKFVLSDDAGALRRSLRRMPDVTAQRIDQGYLTKGVRIRRTEYIRNSKVEFDLTFKRKVGGHVVEIPAEITELDFKRLWRTCETSLEKTRFKFADRGIQWDVDYFGSSKDPYFIMAEAEMPEHLWDTTEVPQASEVIADHVLHVVGKDHGFSSRRLCSRKYAMRLMEDLREAPQPGCRMELA
jgi:CYTH domain-containing protein